MLEVPVLDHIKLYQVCKYNAESEDLQTQEVVSYKPARLEHHVDVSCFRLALIEREDDTRRVGAIFVGLFLTQCHANLRGWGYKYIAASQPRIC
jgi:hypothetical protein